MKKTVLLVDDDEITNAVNRMVLEKTNLVFSIDCVSNGFEALHLLEGMVASKHPMPDLLLLDINMPFMNGFEFLREIQKHVAIDHKALQIIILTSSFDLRDIESAKALGIARYVEKPLSIATALELLQLHETPKK